MLLSRDEKARSQPFPRAQIIKYLSTRFSTLVPSPKNRSRQNPIGILRRVTTSQWLMFLCGMLGRCWDSFDYTTVPLTVTELAKQFDAPNSAVSWAITVTLMTRPIGALLFGTLCDRYGRRWPMIVNLVILMMLELASGFCQSLHQFIAVRSLYGIAMGGLIGPSAAIALEDLPSDARGILSGFFEGGNCLANVFAALMYRALVPTTKHGWRSLYWFGAGPPLLLIILRWWLPETNHFQKIKADREARTQARVESGNDAGSEFKTFLHDSLKQTKKNWLLLLYMFLLMAGFNASSHSCSDLHPTFLKNQVQLDPEHAPTITTLGSLGASIGAIILGYVSGFLGRRLTMMCSCIIAGAILPAYVMTRGMKIGASTFFQQFVTVGAWGVIPVHLVTLAPYTLRTLMVGLTYQLGNLASSPMTTLLSIYGEKFPLTSAKDGTKRYNYGRAIAVFTGASLVYVIIFLLLGPEADRDAELQDIEVTINTAEPFSEPQSPIDSIEKGSFIGERECEVAIEKSASNPKLG